VRGPWRKRFEPAIVSPIAVPTTIAMIVETTLT
jgi:hypothetical protein